MAEVLNTSKASLLRSRLQEHVALVGPALKAEFLQAVDRDAAMDAADMNTEAIADSVDMLFQGSKDEFTELWGMHIGYYVDYTEAVQAGEEGMKESAKQNLQEFAEEASSWFVERNDNYDQKRIEEMIVSHIEQTLAIVDAIAQGDYETVYNTMHRAYEHIGVFADYLLSYGSEEQAKYALGET